MGQSVVARQHEIEAAMYGGQTAEIGGGGSELEAALGRLATATLNCGCRAIRSRDVVAEAREGEGLGADTGRRIQNGVH